MYSLGNNAQDNSEVILIVTWFGKGVVGYLDFKYRVASVQRNYSYVVVSNDQESQKHLDVPPERFILCRSSGNSTWERLKYFFKVARLQRKNHYGKVLLLHSSLAHAVYFLVKAKSFLYWNEHPTHIFPIKPAGKLAFIRRYKNRVLRKLLYGGARRATKVMPIGEHHQQDLIKHGCHENRVKRIYMGVDESFVNEDKATGEKCDETLKLVYTGTVDRDRGRDLMLNAVSAAVKEGAKVSLVMVGANNDQKAYCDSLVKRLGIGRNVTIVGRVPGDTIPGILHQADIGLCFWEDRPYWQYNPPTKLFEYLAAGLPVVASDIRTHSFYLKEGQTGCLCPYDSQCLADILKKLSRERHLVEGMKAAAQQAGSAYLWGSISREFVEALN